ncbi:unnamed protein product [Phytophthora fragariaefolia]|uniref:Unnamed protein product n=1 Tax=Phytophthora fragariaefolia TaxID=1490495 RepID=A0A9W6YFD9_9STRA|nr:unnamed protein product [Phytophthora fragariaefolia]
MAKGSPAVPATPMKSGRIEMEGGPTPQTGSGGRLSSISERLASFDESAGGISEAKDEEVNEYEDSEAEIAAGKMWSNESQIGCSKNHSRQNVVKCKSTR